MTATEMALMFLEQTGMTNGFAITSGEIAGWLNKAIMEAYDHWVYPVDQKRALQDMPRYSNESEAETVELLAPFKRAATLPSSPNGFVAFPNDFAYLTAVGVELGTCDPPQHIPVVPLSDNQAFEIARDPFDAPYYSGTGFNPLVDVLRYRRETLTGVNGLRVLPRQQWNVTLLYLKLPTVVQIANNTGFFAWELPYQPSLLVPSIVTADVNSDYPAWYHPKIVDRAVMLFTKSVPDLNQLGAERATVIAGDSI
jgi:hypothetical protein